MGKKDKRGKKKRRRDGQAPAARHTGRMNLRDVEIPPAPKPMKPADIRALRESLNASQALFARLLNVSSNAVESWEQGLREPRQATLKLLHVAKMNPEVLLS